MLKKSINKKIIIFILALIMLFSCSANTLAALPQQNEITPMWDNISTMSLSLTFDGNAGLATGTARKSPNADLIEGVLYVYAWENNDWQYVDSVYGSKSIGSLGLAVEFEGVSGVEYKAVWIVTAHDGEYAETDTSEYTKVC